MEHEVRNSFESASRQIGSDFLRAKTVVNRYSEIDLRANGDLKEQMVILYKDAFARPPWHEKYSNEQVLLRMNGQMSVPNTTGVIITAERGRQLLAFLWGCYGDRTEIVKFAVNDYFPDVDESERDAMIREIEHTMNTFKIPEKIALGGELASSDLDHQDRALSVSFQHPSTVP